MAAAVQTALREPIERVERRHPAHVNFGDCFAYALAKDKREPLLFKGNHFLHTNVEPAVHPRRQ
jgi:uncharacterized protein with PIN domain